MKILVVHNFYQWHGGEKVASMAIRGIRCAGAVRKAFSESIARYSVFHWG